MFSSKTYEWATPDDFFAGVVAEFGSFDLDPCATAKNAKADRFFTLKQDGLAQLWTGRIWMNPPYGRTIGQWIRKAYESAQAGSLVVALLPARTDTAWFHEYIYGKAEIRFLKGRIRFGNATAGAPFPSMLVIWYAQ